MPLRRHFLTALTLPPLAALAAPLTPIHDSGRRPPNIVVILADDLGYGDLSCYGATRFKTPAIDRLASRGVRFTQGYASSPTCTPTRYGLLTGEYSWRKKDTGILPGDAALIIEPGRATLPSVLRERGYATAAVGKWHLGFGTGALDFNTDLKPGPLELGFDTFFGMPSTSDRVPTVFIRDHRVIGLDPTDPISVSYRQKVGADPTSETNPEMLRYQPSVGHNGTIVNRVSRIGWMSGGKVARFQDEERTDRFVDEAAAFIEKSKDKPFFLYFAAHEPHVPRCPHPRFVGQSRLGLRTDSILELDAAVARLTDSLEKAGVADNTLVVFTSDNGPAPEDGYADGALESEHAAGHDAAGGLRGQKCSVYEGGVRVPFIAVWPKRIQENTTSAAVVCTVDMLATAADLAGRPLGTKDAPDSFSFAPALIGEPYARPALLLEKFGTVLRPSAIRDGDWKLVVSSAISQSGQHAAKIEGLYDLSRDAGEHHNLAKQHPEIAEKLRQKLLADWAAGFTRPGAVRLR